MAAYQDGLDFTFTANADLDSYQYHFVTASGTAPGVNISTGASNPHPTGVLQNDPRSGEAATVRIVGVTKLVVDTDAAIGYGDYIKSSGCGRGVVDTGSYAAAIALGATAALSGSGYTIPVLLLPYGSGNKVDNTP